MKPGEVFDAKGIPVYPGDLIRSPHFTDRRRRKHWLYHVAVLRGCHLEMVPTSHLEPTKAKGGGRCWLFQPFMDTAEIISGHGPDDCLDYLDRPRHGGTLNRSGNAVGG